MSYELTFDQKPAYLHAVVTGRNSKQTVAQCMEDVIRECTARNCGRVLVEERLEGPRLNALDAFEIVEEGTHRFRGRVKAMAYVDVNAQGDSMRFAESVAVNRGFPVAVFSTVAEAENWLREKARGDTGPLSAAGAQERR